MFYRIPLRVSLYSQLPPAVNHWARKVAGVFLLLPAVTCDQFTVEDGRNESKKGKHERYCFFKKEKTGKSHYFTQYVMKQSTGLRLQVTNSIVWCPTCAYFYHPLKLNMCLLYDLFFLRWLTINRLLIQKLMFNHIEKG